MPPRPLGFAAVALLAGCGDTDAPAASPVEDCRAAEGGRVELVARDLTWDAACLVARADQPITIAVDNQDVRIAHNLHLAGAPDSPATELQQGPVSQKLVLEGGLAPGSYEYLCDIHPTMVGRLEVTEANPP